MIRWKTIQFLGQDKKRISVEARGINRKLEGNLAGIISCKAM